MSMYFVKRILSSSRETVSVYLFMLLGNGETAKEAALELSRLSEL